MDIQKIIALTLKQAVMSLVVSGSGGIPIWMEPQDGNSSDKCEIYGIT